ncbi:DUF692 family multinuclear iron-containing protein [Paraburkholderia sp. BR10937]|uniref:DUF692 domain-containing protein n=1 Tax=Paraburkholderia sp. BR10937 TaxID=3236994 RepID=UPI0034D198CE
MSAALILSGQTRRQTGAIAPELGVGFDYFPSLPADMYDCHLIDFVELTPETLCSVQRTCGRTTPVLDRAQLDRARTTCGGMPMVVHGVELSIGSAHGWNTAYLSILDQLQPLWPFLWHSEHLSFQTYVNVNGDVTPIGTPLPLPMTNEAGRLVAQRCAQLLKRYRVPFLLENPAHYLTDLPSDSDITDECVLMNRVTCASGCGQLLDLHNLYCNAVNHGFDPFEAVGRFALERVVEIHVAGGRWEGGYWTDAHDSAAPVPVWELLEYTLPHCPNVAGVVFELLEPHAVRMGADEIARNLECVHEIWSRHAPSVRNAP